LLPGGVDVDLKSWLICRKMLLVHNSTGALASRRILA
jgi:hypothetical protein